MLRNYLLVAYRNFLKQKSYTFINVFGLAFGMACAICIFLYVNNELEYDTRHDRHEDIYGIGVSITDKDGNSNHYPVAPGDWANRLKQNLPEVEQVTKVDWFGYPSTLHDKATDRIILTENIRWVQKNFGEVFRLDIIKGNPDRVLDEPNAILMSESGARKLFGDNEPLNQIISFKHPFIGNGNEIQLMVTGVYKDLPSNVHLKPEFMVSIYSVKPIFDREPNGFDNYYNSMSLNSGFFPTYVKLAPGSNAENLRKELERLNEASVKTDSAFQAQGNKMTFKVEHIRDVHFDEKADWEFDAKGNKTYLTIFSLIAFLILIIACINYMNLATARSAKRAKEVGMRKSMGGLRSELAWQFIQESAIIALISFLFSLVIVALILPYFNDLARKNFTFQDFLNMKIIVIMICVMIFITFAGGAYPAFILSGFNPVQALKGKMSGGKGSELFRKALVGVQFVVAIVMVLGTIIIMKQMSLLQESKLNEHGSQIVSIRFGGTAPAEKYEPFKKAVLEDKDIEHVTIGNHLPRLDFFGFIGTQYRFAEVGDQEYNWSQLNVDYDFPATYGLEFVAGRDFDHANVSDSSSLILNESAVKILNKSPGEVIGLGGEDLRLKKNGKVIGVVRDFPYRSLYKQIEPLVISPRPHEIDRIVYVKLPKGKMSEKIAFLEQTWRKVIPDTGFDYWFLNDEFNRMYKAERTVSSIAKTFTVLALIITVLGLYGLASYTAEQRTKEVGIRKVMGATTWQVVVLFALSFLKIFVIAAVIAIPAAWYLGFSWLKSFVYKTPLDFTLFLLTFLGLLLMTFLTVSYETYKAAITNPVTAIRHE
jgi:putative ABC transport system permease protein